MNILEFLLLFEIEIIFLSLQKRAIFVNCQGKLFDDALKIQTAIRPRKLFAI
jgi:hypothetical protein